VATVSTPAKLSSVKTVFGGPNNLRGYYRNTIYVKNIPTAYPSVPTSGSIRLGAFAGTINPTTYLYDPIYVYDYALQPNDPSASLTIANNGLRYGGAGDSTWLLAGSASDYDVYLQKTSGTTPSGASVNTWLNLATTRTWELTIFSPGTAQFIGLLYIRNTNATNYTLSSSTVTLEVEEESNACPTCCFTPETLILMATGDWMAIVDVQVGDEIATRSGSKKVTEVITRTNRVMYEITFMDGRVLNASEDHPLYVVDKGYAAINPGVGGAYKDLGIPDQLYVGDLVLDSDGKENAIVDITEIDYPHTVYTFMESEFYANGMLVY
jgi:hypothetical protein